MAVQLINGELIVDTPRIFKPLLQEGKRFYRARGGRSSGKSHAVAEMLILEAYERPGLRVLCVRETQKSLKESAKKLLEDKIEALGLGKSFTSLLSEIRGPGGGSFQFTGLQQHNSESVKGFEQIDVCWAEEAASLSEQSIKLLIPTIRAPGSKLYFTYNPKSRSDPVETLINWDDTTRCVSVHANYLDNPFCPQVMIDEANAAKLADEDDYAHTWLGGYQSMGALTVIPAAWIESAVGLAEDLELDVTGQMYSALDVAGAEEGGDENAQAIRKGIELRFVDKWNGLDTSLTTHRALANMRLHGVKEGYYDSASVGEGVTGEWASMGRRGECGDLELHPWNGGMSVQEPDGHIDESDPNSPLNKDQYQNLKSQAWMALRKRFENAHKARLKRDYDPEMLISLPRNLPYLRQIQDELNQPHKKTSGTGKLLVDKAPQGKRSPNLADAICICYFPIKSESSYLLSAWG